MIIKDHCPTCKKVAKTVSESRFAGLVTRMYECGHRVVEKQLVAASFNDYVSEDGKRPFEYQKVGAVFGVQSGVRCLIADEMGLGKTVQALMILKSLYEEMKRHGWKISEHRFMVVCKSRLKIQWLRETMRWNGEDWFLQIIESEKDFVMPGVYGFVVSYDLLWRFKDLPGFVKRLGITTMICDEIQHIKNSDSKRTKGIQTIAQCVKHLVFLSGTPIKNHAGEYFPALNMLRPDKFPTKKQFEMVWVDTYWNGNSLKYGGLKDTKRFHEYTKDFVIRRTREEVMPDLPKVTRDFRFSELGDVVEEAYKETFKQFQDYYLYGGMEDSAFLRQSNILAYLSKMRHLTGLAKIEPTVEYVEDFITTTDRKLVIFVHHQDVAETLVQMLEQRRAQWPAEWGREILYLPANAGQHVIDAFAQPDYRIMIASTLSSGEGLNLQFCSDCIVMERQWNPANEEQAESRFIRIGQLSDKVFAAYMIAVGTVDEFFSELVEKKRAIVANTLDGKEVKWDETSLVKELAEILAQKGGHKWGW